MRGGRGRGSGIDGFLGWFVMAFMVLRDLHFFRPEETPTVCRMHYSSSMTLVYLISSQKLYTSGGEFFNHPAVLDIFPLNDLLGR
jgi:hypothetical protein